MGKSIEIRTLGSNFSKLLKYLNYPKTGITLPSPQMDSSYGYLSKYPCSWFGLLGPFSLQISLVKHIFSIDIHSMQGWTATGNHGVTKKRSTKRKSLEKDPTVNRCLLVLDLKSYPKTRQLNHQMPFCIWGRPHWIWDGKLNTLGYFLFFWLLV